ncbi:2Fe-2S iron-sulfur cluster-binding protein [Sphingomonas sp. AOB5]|uniref:2Fe-2S iron-sulfur cluster-binding protein n=1 Tax=Sphingomonas sp. AOB5 TaxID=3034017 RepID=UPI0023F631FA|nr:2Fe-2S iron-sulfur cluster-binding protein [Sphingomonas sp. AOB5]MDF7774785.1 2Fe-2S iron-sulfur cluster-binding protein [Sphingomonas sp. AOB5]
MPSIIFIEADGRRIEAMFDPGDSVMIAAKDAGLWSIVAQCGGSCSCATCHVFVAAPGFVPPNAYEDELLDCTAVPRRPESRLSCQLRLTDAMDGIIVHVPERQIP